MNARQKKFAEYYAQSGNATAAAISAGYSTKYAHTNAAKLLKLPEIAEYIHQINEAGECERILTAMQRRCILSDIAKSENYTTADRLRAIDILNKMTGEYITQINGLVDVGVQKNPFAALTTDELRRLAAEE